MRNIWRQKSQSKVVFFVSVYDGWLLNIKKKGNNFFFSMVSCMYVENLFFAVRSTYSKLENLSFTAVMKIINK